MIGYQDCLAMVLPILRTTEPIDAIDSILRVPEQPIPTASGAPDGRRKVGSRSKARPWSSYEDQRLLAGIHRFGLDDWQRLAIFVGNGRTKFQCCQRWTRGLDPKLSKDEWTPDLDDKLLQLIAIHGEKSWTRLAVDFGNRCDVQCRYRYKQLLKEERFAERMAAARAKVTADPSEALRDSRTKTQPPPPPAAAAQWPPLFPFGQMAPSLYPPGYTPMYLMPPGQQVFSGMYGMPQAPQPPGQLINLMQQGPAGPPQFVIPPSQQAAAPGRFVIPASQPATAQAPFLIPASQQTAQLVMQAPQPMEVGAAQGQVAAAAEGQENADIPKQPSVQFSFEEQLSAQPSVVDWQSLRLSPSPSNFFGISPMPSLGFGS